MRTTTRGQKIGWDTVIDGLNEVSKKIYCILFDRFEDKGFFECFEQGEARLKELEKRFQVDARVRHRFRIALQGLRALGVVSIEEDRVTILRKERPDEPINDELIFTVFGRTFTQYLEIYYRDMLLNPSFCLTFDGQQATLWEGLLSSPINTVGGDQAVEWIGRPGARVLELAFGPGSTIRQLLEVVGEKGEIFGVDNSAYYVERSREEFRQNPNVKRLIQADINDGLAFFDDGAFDGVMFMGALQFIQDPRALFDEFKRIIRKRGKLVLGAFHTNKPCFSNPALHLHMNMFSPPALEYPVDSVKGWLMQRGFETNITVEFGSYCSLYAEHMPEVL